MPKDPAAVKLGRRGGRKGGKSKSLAKVRAAAENLKRAREKRWTKAGG